MSYNVAQIFGPERTPNKWTQDPAAVAQIEGLPWPKLIALRGESLADDMQKLDKVRYEMSGFEPKGIGQMPTSVMQMRNGFWVTDEGYQMLKQKVGGVILLEVDNGH